MKEHRTLCNRDCPDACSLVATVEEGRVIRLRGDKTHPITRGFLCYRTSRFLDRQYSPDRLTTPLKKVDGKFQAISWNEALDWAAEKLEHIRRVSGPAAIFHYRSGGSLGLLKHLTDYFFEQFGPVTIKRGDICSGAGDAAQLADFGESDSHDVFDLMNSRNILLWGKNLFTSSPHLVPILQDARKKGASVVLIDPVNHKTSTLADRVIQPRPAGDFELAMAVAQVLFDQAWVDPNISMYCDHLQEFKSMVYRRPLVEWCRLADVSSEVAIDLARRLGPGKPASILVGWGMGRRLNGGAIVRSLDALSALSGNLGIPGGGVSFYFKRRGAFEQGFIKGTAIAPRTICEPLFGPELLAARDPLIRAVWITAGNPVAMLPGSATVAQALESREFVVVVDSFLTDTARCAHLVLPAATMLEDDDLLGSYGHHWIGVSTPVIPPPAGVKTDLEIIQELAQRLSLTSVMAGSARQWKQRMIDPKLGPHGITLERLESGAIRNPLAPQVLFADRKFKTVNGRVNLITEPPSQAVASAEYPLVLMSLSTQWSQSSQWASTLDPIITVQVHPDSAEGIPEGKICRLESKVSALQVRVKYDSSQRRDVLLIPKGGHFFSGQAANALLAAKTTDIGEGGALYDERVRLVPLR
jgi:anaerobic selenocysteine-containing dehydrogenase